MCRIPVLLASCATWLLLPLSALAQPLPTGPVSAFDGRLAVGAEVPVAISEEDDTAYFNYTDYEHNALRLFRVGLSASWRPLDRVGGVGEGEARDPPAVPPYR